MFRSGVALAATMTLLIIALSACGDEAKGPDQAAQAVESRDARSLLAALGDPAPDAALLGAVQQQFSQRPSLRLSVVSSRIVSEAGDERIEERRYRVAEPGETSRLLTFEVRSRRANEEWMQVSMIPIAETPE